MAEFAVKTSFEGVRNVSSHARQERGVNAQQAHVLGERGYDMALVLVSTVGARYGAAQRGCVFLNGGEATWIDGHFCRAQRQVSVWLE